MTKAKYEDDTGESGWIADETKEEREAREARERHAASVEANGDEGASVGDK